jgi:hypothetical protein
VGNATDKRSGQRITFDVAVVDEYPRPVTVSGTFVVS